MRLREAVQTSYPRTRQSALLIPDCTRVHIHLVLIPTVVRCTQQPLMLRQLWVSKLEAGADNLEHELSSTCPSAQ